MKALSIYSSDEPILDLGRTDYESCLLKQRQIHSSVALEKAAESIIITEHFPVYTCGRAKAYPAQSLFGIPLVNIERGGDITYHGPGQIVGYPILNLAKRRLSIPQYLRQLECCLMEALQAIGVQAEYREKYRAGLWVGEKKLVSIGIAVRRWVTFHGFALNVDCDLDPFRSIRPCGLAGDQITSLKDLGVAIAGERLKQLVIAKLHHAFFQR